MTSRQFVVELASNDGYLLRNFVEHGIPCLGIEPAANIAKVALERGVSTRVKFFGESTARELIDQGRRADLLVANNVLAHVPNLHDFVEGMKLLLADDGVAVVEVQHLLRLVERNQFDTIYHEHFCYYTLWSFAQVLGCHGFQVFDVEEIPTHGGSVRFYIQHLRSGKTAVDPSVQKLLDAERSAGLHELAGYGEFGEKVAAVKRQLLEFLIGVKQAGQTVVGYGAPGKGNTLLNYCGIRQDLLNYTVDRNPYKQGKFLPGTRIPIYAPQRIAQTPPRLRIDFTVEPARGNRRATRVHPRLGRQVRCTDSSAGDLVIGVSWWLGAFNKRNFGTRHQTPDTRHQTPDTRHQTPDTRPPDHQTTRPPDHQTTPPPMILLDTALAQREAEGRPIRIGLVGAGFMGRGVALQLCTPLVGMRLVAIANRRVDAAQRVWSDAGQAPAVVARNQRELDAAVAAGCAVVTDDPSLLCFCDQIDALIEVTGHVEAGAAHGAGGDCRPQAFGADECAIGCHARPDLESSRRPGRHHSLQCRR